MSNNFVWLEIGRNVVENLQENRIVVVMYINDITSTYYDDKIWDDLYSGILKFGTENTPILLMGDFNGRVGNLDDRYTDIAPLDQNVLTPKLDFDIPIRRNCDTLSNSHGKKIIQLCRSMDLIILNGRRPGDAIGNLTFMNSSKGTSTIDYSLCNDKFYECVENFLVLPLTELSDHSKIVTVLKSSISPPKTTKDTYKWTKLKPKFKWDNEKINKFCNTLQNSIDEIEDIKKRIEAGLIKSTGEKIQDIFNKAANYTFKVKKSPPEKNWKKRNKSKKWFDKECIELKQNVRKIGKQKLKNPEYNLLKSKYHEKLRV